MTKGRPKRLPAEIEAVLVRLPKTAVEVLDAWVEEVRSQVGAGGATRTDLVRDIIMRAVDERRRALAARGEPAGGSYIFGAEAVAAAQAEGESGVAQRPPGPGTNRPPSPKGKSR